MDFTPILQTLLDQLWFLAPVFALAILLKSSWFKGWVGEAIVNLSARLFLDRKTYHLIRNVTLPTEDGTTQIDHIIVSPFGVFVVETKNMKGWIFGQERDRYWTQKIYRHSQKFQNPLHQNYKHVKTVQSLLGLSEDQVYSLVVFVGSSTFKTAVPKNVTQGLGFLRFIKSHTSVVLTPGQVTAVVENIESGRLQPTWRTHRDHVKHVRGIIERKQATTGLFAERDDKPVALSQRNAKRHMLKPLLPAIFLVFAVVYWTGGDKPSGNKPEQSEQVSKAKALKQQITTAHGPPARQEVLKAEQEAKNRARLAVLRKSRERDFERAFIERYVEPEGCNNWRSDRHMVECVNHKMRSKSAFRESYFATRNAETEG